MTTGHSNVCFHNEPCLIRSPFLNCSQTFVTSFKIFVYVFGGDFSKKITHLANYNTDLKHNIEFLLDSTVAWQWEFLTAKNIITIFLIQHSFEKYLQNEFTHVLRSCLNFSEYLSAKAKQNKSLVSGNMVDRNKVGR